VTATPDWFDRSLSAQELFTQTRQELDKPAARLGVVVHCPKNHRIGEIFSCAVGPVWVEAATNPRVLQTLEER
jgi:hypothetical protein